MLKKRNQFRTWAVISCRMTATFTSLHTSPFYVCGTLMSPASYVADATRIALLGNERCMACCLLPISVTSFPSQPGTFTFLGPQTLFPDRHPQDGLPSKFIIWVSPGLKFLVSCLYMFFMTQAWWFGFSLSKPSHLWQHFDHLFTSCCALCPCNWNLRETAVDIFQKRNNLMQQRNILSSV